MSDNQIWINQLVKEISVGIINKYETLNFPFRTVMVKMNYCYCCKTIKDNIKFLAEDSLRGRFKLIGWLYCKDCANLVSLAHKYIFLQKNYLRYSETKFLINKYFNYWRISKTENIKPYLEKKGYFDGSYNNLIYILNGRINAGIVWENKYDIYTKNVNLSNLIYYNKYFFGDNINNTEFSKLENRWIKLINYEYSVANDHKAVDKIYFEYKISTDTRNIIKSFLDNIY